jgi:hypothetical protein
MIARNHVWTPDQSVICTTNVKDCMVYYNPYQGTSFILPPVEPESNNPNKGKDQLPNAGYRAYENLASSKHATDEGASKHKAAKEHGNQRRSTVGRPSKVGSVSDKDESKHHREQQQHIEQPIASPIPPMPTITANLMNENDEIDWDSALKNLSMNSILMAKDLSLVSGGSVNKNGTADNSYPFLTHFLSFIGWCCSLFFI